MNQPLITVVAAALGLISHSRAHRVDLGPPGDALLMAIERAIPGTVAALDEICPVRPPLSAEDAKLRNDVFAKVFGQSVQVAQIDEIKRYAKEVHDTNGGS